jgi:hypothetical protein
MTKAVPLDPTTDPTQNLLRHVQAVIAQRFDLKDYGTTIGGPTYKFAGLGFHAFALPDTTLNREEVWQQIELNVGNAAGGTAHGADLYRVRHECATLLARHPDLMRGDVIIRAYSPDTKVQPEILLRAALLAHEIEMLSGLPSTTAPAREQVAPDAVTVVHGAIPDLAPETFVNSDGSMTYRGHRVVLLCNPNLLGQVARREQRDLEELVRTIEPGLTHEGSWLTLLGFDKTAQQDIYEGTSIVPVAYTRTFGIDETIAAAITMANKYDGAFIKPNAASGGALAVPVDPDDTADDIAEAMAPELELMRRKYGPGWENTCPLAVYEFIHSRPAVVNGAGRRWDFRWAVHARPDEIHITPLLARVCPEPIATSISKANAVCNITGRDPGSVPVLSPVELAAAAGIEANQLAKCAEGLYEGLRNAATLADLPLPA